MTSRPQASLVAAPNALLVNADEAAATLAVSRRTVERLARSGELRVVRIGRTVRFRRADLESLVERHMEVAA